MKMSTKIAALLSATALTACGGGGDSVVGAPPELDSFFFGTELGDAPSNGLSFASEASGLDDLAGEDADLPVLFIAVDGSGQNASVRLFLAETAFDDPPQEDPLENLTVTVFDRTFEFSDRSASDLDGNQASINLVLSATGTFGTVFSINGGLSDETEFDGFGVVGFQTDPATIAALSQPDVLYSANFVGEVVGLNQSGTIVDGPRAILGSNLTFVADFDAGEVSGDFTTNALATFSTEGGLVSPTVLFEFNSASIDGNGFVADLVASCETAGFGCSGGGEIGGVFFGPGAEEIGGLIELDGTIQETGDAAGAIDFQGALGFFGDEVPD